MTQRDELTRAVVEAAREISEQRMTGEMSEAEQENADYEGAYNSLIELIRGPIRALSALDAQASAGEVVEVVVNVRLSNDRSVYIARGMGSLNGDWVEPRMGGTIATIRARVPLPRVPEVVGEVEG